MLCALIMAGGKGTRFWPLSTEEKPKQFLNLLSKETMIQMTVNRLLPIIPIERIFIVTGKKYIDLVKGQLPDLPKGNIIAEPYGKNTAPCIALSAFKISSRYKNSTIAVFPSDHLILNEEEFRKTILSAEKFVSENGRSIVTLGIRPDRPETGYGYIKVDSELSEYQDNGIYKVDEFVEKPCLKKAVEYLNQKRYLWNAGMFIWKTENILDLTKRYLNNTYSILREVVAAAEEKYEKVLEEKYDFVDCVSVDYGIMEKVKDIYVIPSDFGWDDVGTWSSVERYIKKDENNNSSVGNIINIESMNNVAYSKNKTVIINGLNDILFVESDDYILISDKSKIENIKQLREKITGI